MSLHDDLVSRYYETLGISNRSVSLLTNNLIPMITNFADVDMLYRWIQNTGVLHQHFITHSKIKAAAGFLWERLVREHSSLYLRSLNGKQHKIPYVLASG